MSSSALAPNAADIAIRVHNLSKCYQIYDTPRDRLKQFVVPRLQRMVGQLPKQYFREFWALSNVSFEIKKGETVGIIGRNGSGKSTLLQIICGTLTPTSGSVETRGRIAALLELGSGFNPEFTGRENVYMNASVLGLSNEEIDARFNDIVAFADIGDFIEQPVKTYSSGMMVRLAFAVAINVDPEILIVDEALSVGDELFQRKCFSRIETIRANGATILFVSHSGGAIVELCDRAVLMDAGEKLAIGVPKQIVGCYQKLLYSPADKRETIREQIRQNTKAEEGQVAAERVASPKRHAGHEGDSEEGFDPGFKPASTIEYESQGASIESPAIVTLDGSQVNQIVEGKPYKFRYTVHFYAPANNVHFSMLIKAVNGTELSGVAFPNDNQESLSVEGATKASVEFSFTCKLLPGVYYVNAGCRGFINGEEQFLHRVVDVVCFRVLPQSNPDIRAGYFDIFEQLDYELTVRK